MNKDVIYIDVEDDITAIISKVKASKVKIIALVPPKRIGVLQSAVNLRLLARSAENGGKRLVIITNNHALSSLAASAKLPVAKNLQSKPELAPIAALEVDDEDDIIDGNDLPVGEHAKQADNTNEDETAIAAAISASQLAEPPKSGQPTKRAKAKSGAKVPNFNTFRKKMIFGIGGGILLIAFLVWAIVFAPRATIVVAAKTSDSSVNAKVTVSDTAKTDGAKNTIKAIKASKTEKKTLDFAASGSKNVGEKAKGTITFSTNNISSLGTTIPAGTPLNTTGGLAFTTDTAITITINNYQGAQTSVTAAEQGAKYNAATGQLTGAPGGISASLNDATSGGTDKVVKIVTAQDVQKAKDALSDQENKDMEAQLKTSIKNGKAIQGSYRVDYTEVKSTPDVNAESQSGNAVLTSTVVYSLYGLSSSEMGKYLDAYLKDQLESKTDQRVYDNGSSKAEFQDVVNNASGAELTLIATAKIGPQLNEAEIKKQSLGRRTGEIQELLQNVQGVENVEVNYFPFWVSSVPDDEKKVTVQFKVNGAN